MVKKEKKIKVVSIFNRMRMYMPSLLMALATLSLLLLPTFGAEADTSMTPSIPPMPPSSSTGATEPQTAPKVITCPESLPACSIDKSIAMVKTDKGIVFISKPNVHEGDIPAIDYSSSKKR